MKNVTQNLIIKGVSLCHIWTSDRCKVGCKPSGFLPVLEEDCRKIGGGCPRRESAAPHQGNETPDALHGQLIRPEADDVPSRQTRFEVFFQIGGESRPAVVAAVHVDAALDY